MLGANQLATLPCMPHRSPLSTCEGGLRGDGRLTAQARAPLAWGAPRCMKATRFTVALCLCKTGLIWTEYTGTTPTNGADRAPFTCTTCASVLK